MAKLNVLQFICPTGFYGAERWILALARNLDSDDVNCELVVTREPNVPDLEISKRYADLQLPVHELAMSGRFDFSVVTKLCRLIKERNIHIIHTHGYKSDILGVLAAKRAGIKSVCTPHGFENAEDFKLKAFIWVGCQSFRFFDAVVPLSEQLIDQVKPYGINKTKLRYIQNGVDLKEVEDARDQGVLRESDADRSEKIIGFVGQMISRKNIFDILDIFNELCSQRADLRLQLLGDGDQRQELEEYASKLEYHDKIEFVGFVNNRLDYLRSFDLFVMSSSLEGIPRCLMETLAMGIPVAAYNIPGIDQLIEHEQSGLCVPFGEKEALKNQWLRILDDKTLADRLVENGRKWVYEKFAASRMAREYTELFHQLVDVQESDDVSA